MTPSLRARKLLTAAERHDRKGDLESAERYYAEALRVLGRSGGGAKAAALRVRSLCGLAGIQRQQGQHKNSERTYRRALRFAEQAFGPEHRLVATALNDLGVLFKYAGRFTEAGQLYQRALAITEKR